MGSITNCFDIGYEKNQIVPHDELCKKVHCGCMGGMRYSKENNVLLLFILDSSDRYTNYWQDDVFYYMGMGHGDQSLNHAGNRRLVESLDNATSVFLIEWADNSSCRFCGEVKLAGKPFYKQTRDKNGNLFSAVYFPLQFID